MKKTKVLKKKLPKKSANRGRSFVVSRNKKTVVKSKKVQNKKKKVIKKIAKVKKIPEIKPLEIIEKVLETQENDSEISLADNYVKDEFQYFQNSDELLGDIESLLQEARIFDAPNFLQEKTYINNIPDSKIEKEKLTEIEKIINADAVNSELLRKNFNYKVKLEGEEVRVTGTIENNNSSKHIVDLKSQETKIQNSLNNSFQFQVPKKKTFKIVSSLYLREVSKMLLKNSFVRLIYSMGYNTSNFFKYSFYPVVLLTNGIVYVTATAISGVDSLGRNVYGFFAYSKKTEKVPKNRYKEIKQEISKIEPSKLFSRQGLSIYPRIFGFVIVSVLIILIINFSSFVNKLNESKGRVLGISEQAYKNLEDGIKSMAGYDFESAQSNFFDANQKFIEAENEISQNGEIINQILKLIPNQGKQLDYGEKLIETGKLLSESAGYINSSLMDQEGLTLTQKIQLVQENLEKCKDNLKKVGENISAIDENVLPEEYRAQFKLMKDKFPLLTSNIDNITSLFDVSNKILGADGMKRYLLLFQNNNELRPTGGFIGSLAIVDVENGEIKNINVPGGGPYDYKAGITDSFIAPKPMWLINPNFYFWDMNWWYDAPTSYSTILDNFERSGGPTVDGVISVNSDVMVELLKLTGPIHIDKYNIDINSDNFYKEVQDIVEYQYDKEENKPKAIIGEMMDKMLNKLFTDKNLNYVSMMKLFDNGISTKDIQMYFTDASLESEINKYGWSGAMIDTQKDYLSVIFTNIGGGKTDEFIDQKISHKVEVLSNGNIIDTVKIVRKFNKVDDNFFAQMTNKNYMRIYVPVGSQLLEAGGFDKFPENEYVKPMYGSKEFSKLLELQGRISIDKSSGIEIFDEMGKTAYAGWQELKPGEEKVVYVKYQLPFKLNFESLSTFLNGLFKEDTDKIDSYSVVYQKQSGMDSTLDFEYKWSDNLKLIWSNLENFKSSVDFSHDFANGFILDKK